jgi:hypothetical protein
LKDLSVHPMTVCIPALAPLGVILVLQVLVEITYDLDGNLSSRNVGPCTPVLRCIRSVAEGDMRSHTESAVGTAGILADWVDVLLDN